MAQSSDSKLQTVSKVDLNRFLGKWYVIASIPTFLEKNATNATETYHWNEKEKRIDIDFQFHKDSPEGPLKKVPQKGWVHNTSTNAEWRVSPMWPLKFGYLILELADDYSYTVVSTSDTDHVWIMARKATLDDKIYRDLIKKIEARGFDLEKIKKVPQRWTETTSTPSP